MPWPRWATVHFRSRLASFLSSCGVIVHGGRRHVKTILRDQLGVPNPAQEQPPTREAKDRKEWNSQKDSQERIVGDSLIEQRDKRYEL